MFEIDSRYISSISLASSIVTGLASSQYRRVGNSLETVECFLEHFEHLLGVVAQQSCLGATRTQEIIIDGAVFVNDGTRFILDLNDTGTDRTAPLGIVESHRPLFMKSYCGFDSRIIVLGLNLVRTVMRNVYSVEGQCRFS